MSSVSLGLRNRGRHTACNLKSSGRDVYPVQNRATRIEGSAL
jgi:hypothetical protein